MEGGKALFTIFVLGSDSMEVAAVDSFAGEQPTDVYMDIALYKLCEGAATHMYTHSILEILNWVGEIIENEDYSIKCNPASYSHFVNVAKRGVYKLGTKFSHLVTESSAGSDLSNSFIMMPGVFWKMLKLFQSEYIENVTQIYVNL